MTSASVREAVTAYEHLRNRPVQLLAVPVANPDGVALAFPPEGIAYREHAESHVLWRWLGALAPDLVLVAGEDDFGLAAALGSRKVADMGSIPARQWSGQATTGWCLPAPLRSPRHAPNWNTVAHARPGNWPRSWPPTTVMTSISRGTSAPLR